MTPHLAPHRGQGLQEYALIGGLVVIAAITGLSLMGGWVTTAFQGMISTRPATPLPTVSSTGVAPSQATPALAPVAPAIIVPPTPTAFPTVPGYLMAVPLGNGRTVQLNFADNAQLVETVGNYGTTENQLAILEQIIFALENSEPPAPEAEIATLRALAQSGHAAARAQKTMDLNMDALSKLMDPASARTNYQALTLRATKTFEQKQSLDGAITQVAGRFQSAMNYFKANPSPEVEALVRRLSQDMLLSLRNSSSKEGAARGLYGRDSDKSDQTLANSRNSLRGLEASLKNHMRSNRICDFSNSGRCQERLPAAKREGTVANTP